ncbi:methyl-accepting chemotaxis protein [Vibrio ostreicida]|uniref:Methyl-accepting chemotaxis protein n=2 Tax=Vibrio ostreicida TaxID=526588 RepID=A0ABT8C126_9VIBR|nr:methyl-accepting chemotaxis protein [Vibrio ostreicida]MDN3612777.1 methyl-accepting chemotaxis protein [Vibrio ostreicida]
METNTREQNKQIERIASASTQLISSADQVTQVATEAESYATKGLIIVNEGVTSAQQRRRFSEELIERLKVTLSTAEHLAMMSAKVTGFVILIQEVAERTNLLALNAAVEASRAGNAGRGLERAGNSDNPHGSLTAIYTILAVGDDQQDPVVDSARAILDGHVVLSRKLAEQGHFPAIDINASISRCMTACSQPSQRALANEFRKAYSNYLQVKDLLPLGGYQPGQDLELDRAVALYPQLQSYLQQPADCSVDYQQSLIELAQLFQPETGAS